MTCVQREYEVKIKMVQEQWKLLEMIFLLSYNRKIAIYRGKLTYGEGSLLERRLEFVSRENSALL